MQMLKTFYADLHIHIGRDHKNKPVKITGSKNLTITNILTEASRNKGLDLIGIVDCHVPNVQDEITQLIKDKQAVELKEGGIQFESVTLLLGVELELYDQNCSGPIHVLCYFPYLKTIKIFTDWLKTYLKNIQLSSQRVYLTAIELQEKVKQLNGLFIPAHVFTPFKSLYGRGVKNTLTEVFNPDLIDAIELGLSSDTTMVEEIDELNNYTFLTNSDAHSLIKMAREYQTIAMEASNFTEFKLALHEKEGRRMIANYGMHPRLGKYYQSICKYCDNTTFSETVCLKCSRKGKIKGVAERIKELKGTALNVRERPPYYYHVPLDYLHGLGEKTYQKMLGQFGTEMNILHQTNLDEIKALVGIRIANQLKDIRSGRINIHTGGGGKYGKISES